MLEIRGKQRKSPTNTDEFQKTEENTGKHWKSTNKTVKNTGNNTHTDTPQNLPMTYEAEKRNTLFLH